MFKPLQATMFSLLCFYVASAAYRAFRAKNLQAILLLITASIILLGQTIAGNWLTGWIPESSRLAPFKIKNLVEYVAVFLTAGSRAIMIGIAHGGRFNLAARPVGHRPVASGNRRLTHAELAR